MRNEIKKQVLTASKRFLTGHPRAGEPTYFEDQIKNGQSHYKDGWSSGGFKMKIHTIRGNYSYWADIFERGMLLSVRQWIGQPYKKPGQEVITDIEPGKWGIQKITMINGHNGLEAYVGDRSSIDIDVLASNDGLSRADFEAWFAPQFKQSDRFEGVIIHFTDFRY